MARKNRVSVKDGIFHITSRIAHKMMLFDDKRIKKFIFHKVVEIAKYCGIDVFACCVMDNHLHILAQVPSVPREYWLDRDREPEAWAFGMRPAEVNPPLWSAGGDSPSPARPEVGFMLSDDAMLERLAHLYSPEYAGKIAKRWKEMRKSGNGGAVDAEKRRHCRRMYNLSQFVKTLKERIAMHYNRETGHEGCLWQGRFHSGIVEDAREVLAVVAGYVEYNPVKAGLVSSPLDWEWCSFAAACNEGVDGGYFREMYGKMFKCSWDEAREIMESVLADRLPAGVTAQDIEDLYDKESAARSGRGQSPATDDGGQAPAANIRASQAIHCSLWLFKKGGYIGRTMDFAERMVRHLPAGFPRPSFKSIRRCLGFNWELPKRSAA